MSVPGKRLAVAHMTTAKLWGVQIEDNVAITWRLTSYVAPKNLDIGLSDMALTQLQLQPSVAVVCVLEEEWLAEGAS